MERRRRKRRRIGHKNDEKKWKEVRGKSCKNLSRKCLSCISFWTLLILRLLICCQTQLVKGKWHLYVYFDFLGQIMECSFDSEQKNWILKKFYVSSSAGNPGCHWIMGLKIKSYYQICAFRCKLDQEKAKLLSKNWEFI